MVNTSSFTIVEAQKNGKQVRVTISEHSGTLLLTGKALSHTFTPGGTVVTGELSTAVLGRLRNGKPVNVSFVSVAPPPAASAGQSLSEDFAGSSGADQSAGWGQ